MGYNADMKTAPLLSSKVWYMHGRQRIASTLELGSDKIVRLYKNNDHTLLFSAPAHDLMYSAGGALKSRLRLSTIINGQESGVRIGVKSADQWIETLQKHGAVSHPTQPEARYDKIGIGSAVGFVVLFLALLLFI